MYDPKSGEATEFIDHEEILETLDYAKANKSNRELIEQIIEKASACKGLSHREASVLLECDQEDLNEKMFTMAKKIKTETIWQSHCYVCAIIPFQLLCKWLCVLSVSS